MDPNACLQRIQDSSRIDSLECREAIVDLAGWLARGGFAPDWDAYPLGTKRFNRRCAKVKFVPAPGSYWTHGTLK